MLFLWWTCGDDVRTRVEPLLLEWLDLLPILRTLRALAEGEGRTAPLLEPEEDAPGSTTEDADACTPL
jgi:hypothetical protein